MLAKILTFGLILIGVFAAFRAFGRAATEQIERGERSAREAVKRRQESEEMVKCDKCDAWVHPNELATCRSSSSCQYKKDTSDIK